MVTAQSIDEASKRLEGVAKNTPLQFLKRLSETYNAKIYLKREDLQEVRSFKIRGAYNKIAMLTDTEKVRGVVCASAGNHAQGVAISCSMLGVKGTIFMPTTTPNQKIDKVRMFGGSFVEIQLIGSTFDEAKVASVAFCTEHNAVYVHAFDDPDTISGQGTVGKEIYEKLEGNVDVVVVCVGGGGLIAGTATYLKEKNPSIRVIGSEPKGSPGMAESLKAGHVVTLPKIDTFVDGAAIATVGQMSFDLCQKYVDEIVVVDEGQVCTTMIELYQNKGIVAEPAGALAVAALENIKDQIVGKSVVCVLSGGNNDLMRYPEIMERSLVWQGRKHYFIVEFAQKPGQLRQFLNNALGENDDIVRFEYMKKTNKEKGPALVGIEFKQKEDYAPLLKRMDEIGIKYTVLCSEDVVYQYLI